MSVDVREDQQTGAEEAAPARRGPSVAGIRTALGELEWRKTLLTALVMAVGWSLLFMASSLLQILAGVVPVLAGLWLGRQVKQHLLLHGLVLGFGGFLFGLAMVAGYGLIAGNAGIAALNIVVQPEQPPIGTLYDLVLFYLTFALFALIPFPAFGTVIAGRSEQRNREMRQQVEERGGRLERPGVVRTLDDLQGLSLPQLGSYVINLFRKKGFEFQDYRFIDKDRHLDIELAYQEEIYLLRLSVADKVRSGTLESLVQDMRRRSIPKGLVIASTEFAPEVYKGARSRSNVLVVDGPTLFDMAEN